MLDGLWHMARRGEGGAILIFCYNFFRSNCVKSFNKQQSVFHNRSFYEQLNAKTTLLVCLATLAKHILQHNFMLPSLKAILFCRMCYANVAQTFQLLKRFKIHALWNIFAVSGTLYTQLTKCFRRTSGMILTPGKGNLTQVASMCAAWCIDSTK